MKMKFEQIAIHDSRRFPLKRLFSAFPPGGHEWTTDVVVAKGIMQVGDGEYIPVENEAILQFNYTLFPGKELELIHYTRGQNFLAHSGSGKLSHFGFHVVSIDNWRGWLAERGFTIVQEVITQSHESQLVDKRYHYAIYQHPDSDYCWKLIERVATVDAVVDIVSLEGKYLLYFLTQTRLA
jgi:hypothetical protein